MAIDLSPSETGNTFVSAVSPLASLPFLCPTPGHTQPAPVHGRVAVAVVCSRDETTERVEGRMTRL